MIETQCVYKADLRDACAVAERLETVLLGQLAVSPDCAQASAVATLAARLAEALRLMRDFPPTPRPRGAE